MKCPRCGYGGKPGWVRFERVWPGGRFKGWVRCDYEGCHNGQVHCCDGENVDLAARGRPADPASRAEP